MQQYHIIPELQPYIREICTMEHTGVANALTRVLPDTSTELFINYGVVPTGTMHCGERHEGVRSFINARLNRYTDVEMHPFSKCMGVWFYPGMAYTFFGLPMHLLNTGVISLGDIWKNIGAELEERLVEATDNHSRVAMVQSYLLRILQNNCGKAQPISFLLHDIRKLKGNITVKEIAARANLSDRQLSRKFNIQVGLSPKEYTAMIRFLYTLRIMKQNTGTLTEIAYESGYYDQAHFIHDCKRYTGYTPGLFLKTDNILSCEL